MFTPGQVSIMLQIPGSSLRRYAALFADRLSLTARRRKRLYTDQEILTLQKVRDLAGQGLTVTQIAERLDVVVDQEPPANALALLPSILQEFEEIRSRLAQMETDQQSQLDALRVQVDQLAQELERQRRPWWKRLRKG